MCGGIWGMAERGGREESKEKSKDRRLELKFENCQEEVVELRMKTGLAGTRVGDRSRYEGALNE